MHPILDDRRRLGMYLAGWVPISVFVTSGPGYLGQGREWTAAGLYPPLHPPYGFVCLSAWYVCRVFPMEQGASVPRAVAVHIVAAATASAMWVGLSAGLASALDAAVPGLGARALHDQQRSLVFLIGVLLFWL